MIKKFIWTESQFREYDSENAGFCLKCGTLHYGVEPDARGYQCDECDSHSVMGASEMLIQEKITLIESLSEEEACDIAEGLMDNFGY